MMQRDDGDSGAGTISFVQAMFLSLLDSNVGDCFVRDLRKPKRIIFKSIGRFNICSMEYLNNLNTVLNVKIRGGNY